MIPNGPELLIILVIVMLLFGPSRMQKIGKSIGKAQRAIKDGMDTVEDIKDTVSLAPKAKEKKPAAEGAPAKATPKDSPTETADAAAPESTKPSTTPQKSQPTEEPASAEG